MQFDHPWVLAALPVLAAFVAWLEMRIPGRPARRGVRFLARLVLLGLLLATLAGPHTRETVPLGRRLVVALDRATRLGPDALAEAATAVAQARAAAAADGVAFTLVGFTTRAAPPGSDPPAAVESDLAAGLAGARLAFQAEETGGVLVVTDGHGSLGGAAATAAQLRAEGLAVNGVAVPRTVAPGVRPPRVAALRVPRTARGPFAVDVAVEAEGAVALTAVLRVDGTERERRAVPPPPRAEVRFPDLDLAPGHHEVAVVLVADAGGDAPAAGLGVERALVEVGAPPRVVALLGDAAGSPFRQALGAQGLAVAAIEPAALADFVGDGREAPDLLLADAAALAALVPADQDLLATRVRAGLGLLVEAGGSRTAWEALATGALADLLPLRPLPEPRPEPPPPAPTPPEEVPEPPIDPPEEDEGPGHVAERQPEEALPITLLLVVDRSPSMEGAKLQLAIEGARRAAMALSAWDRLGVITFAHDATLNVPPRSARSASSLPLWLSTVTAGGEGTNIFGALQLAARVLAEEDAPILHLLLLTDGRQYPDGPIFGPVVKPMRDRGITITAVGIGRGARLDQLRDIVQWAAGGMVIPVADAGQLPTVLTRDTRGLAERRSVQARALARLRDPDAVPEPAPAPEEARPARPREPTPSPAVPPPPDAPAAEAPARRPLRLGRPHEALAGLEQAPLPAVGPPRRGEAAPAGAVLLERDDGAPVLVAGRAGLGRVLVWSLPPKDEGALAWPLLGRLVGQAARSVLAPQGAFAWLPVPRVVPGPDGALLFVDWPRGETHGAARVRWSCGEAVRDLGTLRPDDDDQEGRALPAAPAGTLCRLDLAVDGGASLPPLTYLAPAPATLPAQAGDARALADGLGTPLLDPARFVAALPHADREAPRSTWHLALALALAWLALDVWLHRRGGIA